VVLTVKQLSLSLVGTMVANTQSLDVRIGPIKGIAEFISLIH